MVQADVIAYSQIRDLEEAQNQAELLSGLFKPFTK